MNVGEPPEGRTMAWLKFGLAFLVLGTGACSQVPPVNPATEPSPQEPKVPPARQPHDEPKTPPLAKALTIDVGGNMVKTRLAMTKAERHRGLMGVTTLPDDEGMLFVYKTKDVRRFWMKDCALSLDIAFLADDGKVLKVETLDPPRPGTPESDLVRAIAPEPIHYVFEVPAGWFKRKGLKPGAVVKLPASIDPKNAE